MGLDWVRTRIPKTFKNHWFYNEEGGLQRAKRGLFKERRGGSSKSEEGALQRAKRGLFKSEVRALQK